ncbi:MAG: MATE family efflux transporter [Oscillospiraceae bacterium]
MQETKPLILLEKYRSLLISAMIVESVTFIVSLTDSLVAANCIGSDALSSVGLFSPFFSICTFVTAVVNSGTMMLFSADIGRFDKKQATVHFSQGCITAVIFGVLLTAIVFLIKPLFVSSLSITPEIESYLSSYYSVATLYFLFAPIGCLLDNAIVADGGEKLSVAANTIQIVENVLLSFLLAKPFGIVGIAAATVGCKAVFILLVSIWFFTKKNTLRFVWHFSFKDLGEMFSKGIVRASTYALTALMMWLLNRFVLEHYNITTFQIWVIAQKILGLSTIFEGFSLTLRPIISTLQSENNTKAMRAITLRLLSDLVMIGVLCTTIIFCFTAQLLHIYGIKDGEAFEQGINALRIMSITIVFGAQAVMFFIYYFLIDKPILSLMVGFLKDLICPVGLIYLLESFHKGDSICFGWDLRHQICFV